MSNDLPKPFLNRVKIISTDNRWPEEGVLLKDFGLYMFVDEGDKECTLDVLVSDFAAENPRAEFEIICEDVKMGFSCYGHEVVIEGLKAMN